MKNSAAVETNVAYASWQNVVLLNAIHLNRKEPLILKLLQDCGIEESDPILHQGTFLGFSYVTLVWLWETVKKNPTLKSEIFEEIEFDFSTFKSISSPLDIREKRDYLRVLRNALSHSKVTISSDTFVFTDIDKTAEKQETKIKISWSDLAKFSEAFMFSYIQKLKAP
jgi:hypothetical protein